MCLLWLKWGICLIWMKYQHSRHFHWHFIVTFWTWECWQENLFLLLCEACSQTAEQGQEREKAMSRFTFPLVVCLSVWISFSFTVLHFAVSAFLLWNQLGNQARVCSFAPKSRCLSSAGLVYWTKVKTLSGGHLFKKKQPTKTVSKGQGTHSCTLDPEATHTGWTEHHGTRGTSELPPPQKATKWLQNDLWWRYRDHSKSLFKK